MPSVSPLLETQLLSRHYSSLPQELQARGLVADLTTGPDAFAEFLQTPRTIYCGIDPTAGSLHVGNLVPLLTLFAFQLKGHQTIALLGGATGLIGDPSGRDEERPLQTLEAVQKNSASIQEQLQSFFANASVYAEKRSASGNVTQRPVVFANNLNWWKDLSLVDFLHSSGKFVRVSSMLARESVKNRMASSSGISFSEFSYQLLQAHDFWHLYRHNECRIQIGGSDQWGNIVAGLDLIARREPDIVASEGGKAFGLTTPLLTTSSGQKFGKSAGNAIWLDRTKTSVFDFYQFFIRTSDQDVEKYLRIFSLLSETEIEAIMQEHKSQPELRMAQRKLACEVTEMIHGESGVVQAQAATRLLYDTELSNLDPHDAEKALQHDPRYYSADEKDLFDIPLSKLAAVSGLSRSRGEAVRLIEAGGLYLNHVAVSGKDRKLQPTDLLGNRIAILRAGKDKYVLLALKQ
ncbi:hypothetical protein M422DRAFT_68690 [Sphaerobolus stellatus SS14]|uniref:Tyrosine--tRNA ligase n=1 Tax=Sphaerobolus stellatus (strain SS14) TaxID=990650 RepID=A0A0C9U9W0_SPHS4|nr:hypothetical protein M422DRAFT_68690 [Sphaerobolus stellatus SS14]